MAVHRKDTVVPRFHGIIEIVVFIDFPSTAVGEVIRVGRAWCRRPQLRGSTCHRRLSPDMSIRYMSGAPLTGGGFPGQHQVGPPGVSVSGLDLQVLRAVGQLVGACAARRQRHEQRPARRRRRTPPPGALTISAFSFFYSFDKISLSRLSCGNPEFRVAPSARWYPGPV